MKFSAAGGWWGKDWYERVRLGEKYGFPGVEQLGWLGLDFDLAKKTLDETGVTSTAIVIQSVKKENMEKTAWSHGMVWEDSRPAFLESFRESARRNNLGESTTRVIRFTELTADEHVSRHTGFPVGTELYYIQRVRSLDGDPCVFDINLYDKKLVPGLTKEICVHSIYNYIENELGMPIVMSKRTITVERVTQMDEDSLDLKGYDTLAVVTGQTFNSEGVMFEYTQTRHRPDYFTFQTTALRNKKKPSAAQDSDADWES